MINILNPRLKIPYYLYSKIFTRIYTMETNFYKDLNRALSNNNILDFRVFIFTLYNGLDRKVLDDFHDKPLYRATIINKEEYEKIIKLSHRLVLTRQFLSFSKDKDITMMFLKHNDNNKDICFICC